MVPDYLCTVVYKLHTFLILRPSFRETHNKSIPLATPGEPKAQHQRLNVNPGFTHPG